MDNSTQKSLYCKPYLQNHSYAVNSPYLDFIREQHSDSRDENGDPEFD